jgi:hypothetical protein
MRGHYYPGSGGDTRRKNVNRCIGYVEVKAKVGNIIITLVGVCHGGFGSSFVALAFSVGTCMTVACICYARKEKCNRKEEQDFFHNKTNFQAIEGAPCME